MKSPYFNLSEYYIIANGDKNCLDDLLENTSTQLQLFLVHYEKSLTEGNVKQFRDNLHRMSPIFEMLQMNYIAELAQAGRKIIIDNQGDKKIIEENLQQIKPPIQQIIHQIQACPKTKISG